MQPAGERPTRLGQKPLLAASAHLLVHSTRCRRLRKVFKNSLKGRYACLQA